MSRGRAGLSLAILLAASPALCRDAAAQSSNGSFTITHEGISSGGGELTGNPMSARTVLGLPASGAASNGTFSLVGGLPTVPVARGETITKDITVTGTLDDPGALVTVCGAVNCSEAEVSSDGTFTSLGVTLSLGPNLLTATATDSLGHSASSSITVILDLQESAKEPASDLLVTGQALDPSLVSVFVNGVAAELAPGPGGTAFRASIPVTTGGNPVTAEATDAAGNTAAVSIMVYVAAPANPPPMPTVGTAGYALPGVTTETTVTTGGTKTSGTSIWVNGAEVAAADDQTSWTTTLTLVEGDNEFEIVAKDRHGVASAGVHLNVILDNLPPVLAVNRPLDETTNFDPYLLTGTVDDSLAAVVIDGVPAARSGREFQLLVPLSPGPNALLITATSANDHVSTEAVAITRGTIPTIASIQPADASKLYFDVPVAIQATAADAENDPLECQILLDDQLVVDWFTGASHPWTPSGAEAGVHTLEVRVRDAYGGFAQEQADVTVIRPPVSPP